MYKKLAIISNLVLVIYFLFDMTGLAIGNFILVEAAFEDDFIFFLIYIVCFILFTKFRIGNYILSIWLSLWFITQFFSHWYYTIFGASQSKLENYNNYFKNTFHIVPASDQVLIPDLYHILLHILILFTLFTVMLYHRKSKHEN